LYNEIFIGSFKVNDSLQTIKKMSSSDTSKIPNSLQEHWMPFTSNKDFKENPRLITEAKGVYLKNHHGKTMIDASSGLFCNPLGHGRKEITNAVAKQLEQLDYVQPFRFWRLI